MKNHDFKALYLLFEEFFLFAEWLGAKLHRIYRSGGAKKPAANPTKTGPKL
jgi:hypothetical protein